MADKKIAALTQIDAILSADWFIVGDASASDDAKKASPTQVKAGLSLNNVTNDAQLTRGANDLNSFTLKSSPVNADVLVIEDSAASYAKKKTTIGNLPSNAPRVYTTSSTSSLTPNVDSYDHFSIYAQAASTLTINAPSGSPANCMHIVIRVRATTGVTVNWNAIYKQVSGTMPTSISSGYTMIVELMYNSESGPRWETVAGGTGATG